MGLLSSLTNKISPQRKPTDENLLFAAMILMAGADGSIEAGELASVGAFATTLPEFKGKDLRRISEDAVKVVKRYKSIDEAVDALRELSSDAIKTKCYVICADIALASGDVDEAEDRLLERMQKTLGVDAALAQKIVEVLSLKYAR